MLSRTAARTPVEPVLGPGKLALLLTYLSCRPTRRAQSDELVELFWSDRDARTGRHDLRQAIWQLRRRLGRGAIECSHGDVTLRASVTVDRDEFFAAVKQDTLERAVAVYGGPFLPSSVGSGARGFEEWAERERFKLRAMYCRAAEAVVHESLVMGRFEVALELAKRVRAAHPNDEGCARLYLETLLAAGEWVRVASEADALEWQLAVGGREGEPATQRVLRRARNRRTRDPVPDARLTPPRLVGRQDQLAIVLQGWVDVERGVGTHLDVAAAAGFGKTRFLKEIEARLAALGARCVYLAANPSGRDVHEVFASDIATALAGLPGAAGVSQATAAALVALAPSLSSHFPGREDLAVGSEANRRRMLALVELLQALSEEEPLVLLLDDMHWADAGSRRIIHGLIERVETRRCLVVTAARPVAPAHLLTSRSRVVHLARLELDDVTTLLKDLGAVPVVPWAEELPVRLRAVAAGSPLVLLEVLQEALDQGVLTLSETGWSCKHPEILADELERLRAARSQPIESHPRSLLVAPFVSPPAGDLEHLADGFTERLIAALSRVAALRVISWPSARKLRFAQRDAASLAGEVNARYVVQGTLRSGVNDVHITAQLIDAATGAALWGDASRGTLAELSDIGQGFARSIAETLFVAPSPTEDDRIGRLAIPNARAYECYVRAREAMWHGHTPDRLRRAASLLRTGLREGGNNALLYAALGTVYVEYGVLLLDRAWYPRTEVCARKALAVDPECADAYYLRGLVECRRANSKAGVRDLLRAVFIDPHHTDALFWCTGWLGALGRVEAARPLAQRLLEADPLTPANLSAPGWVEWMDGRFQSALTWYRRWLEAEPRNPAALHAAAGILIWNQCFDEGAALFEEIATVAPNSPLAQYRNFVLPALRGDRAGVLAGVTPEVRRGRGVF